MKALVIGYMGFVGRHLVPMLSRAGYDVYGTEQFEHFVLDYRSKIHYDVIVHLGANIVNVHDRMRMGMKAYDDILLDKMVCEYVENHPPSKAFIVMSSCAVDFASDPYCIVKRTLEGFASTLLSKGIPVRVLRPFSGYGSDQSVEYPYRALWERALAREDPLTVWGGDQIRDWVWIDDLCSAILMAISSKFDVLCEVGTGIGTSLRDLARLIAEAAGYEPEINCDYSRATSSGRRIAGANGITTAQALGWTPEISIRAGIAKTAQFFRESKRL